MTKKNHDEAQRGNRFTLFGISHNDLPNLVSFTEIEEHND